MPLFCSYCILMSSVIYYWTDAQQYGSYLLLNRHMATWNLFVKINSFHVAVHLFSNRSQMMPKCGQHKNNSQVCYWCPYHILMSCVIYYWRDTQLHEIYLCYTIKKQTTTAIRELAFAHFGEHEESHLIRVLNEKSVSDGRNLCPLWLVIIKSSLT